MPVYNLTVADAHLFYANGILSSNTDGEDHAPDALRYGCMSRPFLRVHDPKPQPKFGLSNYTMDDLWREHSQGRRASRI